MQKQFAKKIFPPKNSLKKCFNQKNNFAEKKCCQKKIANKISQKKFPLKNPSTKDKFLPCWNTAYPNSTGRR